MARKKLDALELAQFTDCYLVFQKIIKLIIFDLKVNL